MGLLTIATLLLSGWTRPPVSLPRLAQRSSPLATRQRSTPITANSELPLQEVFAAVGSTFGSTSAVFYRQGTLVLEDGTRLRGVSFGYEASMAGELVFTTGMVGYPESLTDPSYKGQMLVMTYPIVGNYGVPVEGIDEYGLPKHFESDKVQVAALIVADYSHHHSHWNSQRSLSQWLIQQKVPALYGLDTRLLTKKIREKGALRARIEFEEAVSVARPDSEMFVDVNTRNLVAEVSIKEPVVYGAGNTHKILALDCGIKVNIIRSLVQRDCQVRSATHCARANRRNVAVARASSPLARLARLPTPTVTSSPAPRRIVLPPAGDAAPVEHAASRQDRRPRRPLPLQRPGRPGDGLRDRRQHPRCARRDEGWLGGDEAHLWHLPGQPDARPRRGGADV